MFSKNFTPLEIIPTKVGMSCPMQGFLRGFTLTEIVLATVLMGMVILAVASIDITSRKFVGAASNESRVQDEVKIAMAHIVGQSRRVKIDSTTYKQRQIGVGDMTNPRAVGDDPHDASGCSRGFYILDGDGNLANSGSWIQIKCDLNNNGKFDSGTDKIIEYSYEGDPDYKIVYDPDIGTGGDEEDLAVGIATTPAFSVDSTYSNQVKVEITARYDPSIPESREPDNPETTLTSSIVLRAMSCDD